MSLVNKIFSRRSVRHYQSREIPESVLYRILEAGRQAPSAANRQPLHFIVLNDYEIKKELSKGLFNRFIKDSPIAIVGCAHTGDILTGRWSIIDTSIALQNMVIAAWAMGIGSCWIGSFKEDKVKMLLNIPKDWKIVSVITFGYPAKKPKPRIKKQMEKLVSFNKF